MPRDLAVQGMQLEDQVLAGELLLKSGVVTAGLGHQAAQHPEEKTEFHAHEPRLKMERRRIVAVCEKDYSQTWDGQNVLSDHTRSLAAPGVHGLS
ncbi:hypothetical protein TUM18999_02310 [Pseudomonas tohonis]|uniref:Uncharacterized protein n=1 Tax=Pseudomonas tohonis TaxID=2725477 RepID=A0A6J4DX81_9PSED|nr:hypothetical protein TUM18999_02310 [Pseudomonas tohonis]GJN52741.1 hypothetical protein TUM20286_24930 [Pseudomonas tohonis]